MTPSVDWLDPARDSCLIDGVRYTRADRWDECWVRRGHVTGLLHLANENDLRAVKILVPIDQHPRNTEER